MNTLITGADGFIGRALVARLLDRDKTLSHRLVLLDQQFAATSADPRVRTIAGDISDPEVIRQATQDGIDTVFHLASIPGGLAEREFDLGLKVNLHGMLTLLDALRHQGNQPRFVFASSIGVYGVPMPTMIDEDTIPEPSLSYGAQKLIGEVLVSDYSRRGFVEGCSLRLPGIVARPSAGGMLSIFLSDIIRKLMAGEPFTCPVSANGKSWWMSRSCLIDNLLHAATLQPARMHPSRVWLLPVLHSAMSEVVAAIERVSGHDTSALITYQPDATLEAQFASYPPLHCARSQRAGFTHDGSLEKLVVRALEN